MTMNRQNYTNFKSKNSAVDFAVNWKIKRIFSYSSKGNYLDSRKKRCDIRHLNLSAGYRTEEQAKISTFFFFLHITGQFIFESLALEFSQPFLILCYLLQLLIRVRGHSKHLFLHMQEYILCNRVSDWSIKEIVTNLCLFSVDVTKVLIGWWQKPFFIWMAKFECESEW